MQGNSWNAHNSERLITWNMMTRQMAAYSGCLGDTIGHLWAARSPQQERQRDEVNTLQTATFQAKWPICERPNIATVRFTKEDLLPLTILEIWISSSQSQWRHKNQGLTKEEGPAQASARGWEAKYHWNGREEPFGWVWRRPRRFKMNLDLESPQSMHQHSTRKSTFSRRGLQEARA